MNPLSASLQLPRAPGMESTRRKADHRKFTLGTAPLRALTAIRSVKGSLGPLTRALVRKAQTIPEHRALASILRPPAVEATQPR
jgi:hypothetical protein